MRSIAILELQHYLQPTRYYQFVLRTLGLRRLLRTADYISTLLIGSRVPNGIRSGWDQSRGGEGVPTKNVEVWPVAVGPITHFTINH